MGTLGLLLRAKRRNLIEQMKPLLASLKEHGMFVSRDLEARTLLAAGETQ
jgi:predicted nucleic acid-binding protein